MASYRELNGPMEGVLVITGDRRKKDNLRLKY